MVINEGREGIMDEGDGDSNREGVRDDDDDCHYDEIDDE